MRVDPDDGEPLVARGEAPHGADVRAAAAAEHERALWERRGELRRLLLERLLEDRARLGIRDAERGALGHLLAALPPRPRDADEPGLELPSAGVALVAGPDRDRGERAAVGAACAKRAHAPPSRRCRSGARRASRRLVELVRAGQALGVDAEAGSPEAAAPELAERVQEQRTPEPRRRQGRRTPSRRTLPSPDRRYAECRSRSLRSPLPRVRGTRARGRRPVTRAASATSARTAPRRAPTSRRTSPAAPRRTRGRHPAGRSARRCPRASRAPESGRRGRSPSGASDGRARSRGAGALEEVLVRRPAAGDEPVPLLAGPLLGPVEDRRRRAPAHVDPDPSLAEVLERAYASPSNRASCATSNRESST